VPESFNVLVRELQSLCLDVELIDKNAAVEVAEGDGTGRPVVATGGPAE